MLSNLDSIYYTDVFQHV